MAKTESTAIQQLIARSAQHLPIVRDSELTLVMEKRPRMPLPLPPPPQPELGADDVTEAIPRAYATSMLVKVMALMTIAVVAGAFAGRFVARGDAKQPVLAPAAAAAPTSEPIATPARPPAVLLVTVKFESSPAGATVQLVEASGTVFVGTTPVTASIDPARVYDVVFTLDGQAPKLERLAAAATRQLSVSFERPRAERVSARTERRAKPRKQRRRVT